MIDLLKHNPVGLTSTTKLRTLQYAFSYSDEKMVQEMEDLISFQNTSIKRKKKKAKNKWSNKTKIQLSTLCETGFT